MNQACLKRSRRRESGFSLIELLVSMTIGLVIMAAAMSAFIGSSGAGRVAEAQSRMNEDAQAALSILSQQIRMAGNNPDQPNRVDNLNPTLSSVRNPVYGVTTLATGTFTTSNFSIRGCDAPFTNLSTAGTTLDTLTCGAAGTSTVADSIAVSYEADPFNTSKTSGGLATDCLGSALPVITATLPTVVGGTTTNANVTYTVADNRFYIGTSAAIVAPTLYCKGNSSVAQPLVENIEDMQLTYGTVSTATTATTANIAGYLAAGSFSDASTVALGTDGERWAKVVTVRICVVVRSENPVVTDAASARYLDCTGAVVTNPPDLRLRRAYTTTVVLRNRRL
jgi:type IV pilus assembly protein PilW